MAAHGTCLAYGSALSARGEGGHSRDRPLSRKDLAGLFGNLDTSDRLELAAALGAGFDVPT